MAKYNLKHFSYFVMLHLFSIKMFKVKKACIYEAEIGKAMILEILFNWQIFNFQNPSLLCCADESCRNLQCGNT